MMNQRVGFVVRSPQTSHLNSCSVVMAQFLLSQWLVTPTRDRGLGEIWCQNREFADLFPLPGTTQVGGMVHHPNLRNDFTDQPSMAEKSHHRTLRNYNAHRLGHSTHVGGGNMTAAEPQRHVHLCGHGVEIAARGKDDAFATYHEPTVQLRQFLDGSAEIEIADMSRRLRMPQQRVQNQWSGFCEHGGLIPECEWGANPPSLSTFATNFD